MLFRSDSAVQVDPPVVVNTCSDTIVPIALPVGIHSDGCWSHRQNDKQAPPRMPDTRPYTFTADMERASVVVGCSSCEALGDVGHQRCRP